MIAAPTAETTSSPQPFIGKQGLALPRANMSHKVSKNNKICCRSIRTE